MPGPSVGDTTGPRTFGPIDLPMVVRYAGASGDFNPLHYDQSYASEAGYPSLFSQGMFQAGLLATLATDWLGPRNLRRFRVRFGEQVWLGDVLECSGVVTAIEPAGSGNLVTVDLTCRRPNGSVAITGSADFLLGGDAT